MSNCPFCFQSFRSAKAISSHLNANSFCRSRLLLQVPPVPPIVNREFAVTAPVRRPTRQTDTASPVLNSFPDDLSDFPMDLNSDTTLIRDPSPRCTSHISHHSQCFQIPSEIIKKAQNLNITSHSDSDDSFDMELNQLQIHGHTDSSTAAAPANYEEITDDLVVESHLPNNGYNLGDVFPIADNEDFDMLDAFPSSLVSMTRILHYCRSAAVPLYLIDGILKIVSEEVCSKRLNLMDAPSYRSTMKDLSNLFSVPVPHNIAIPLERTLSEQATDFYPRSPVFPTFSFLEQLQDLLSMSDIFRDVDNLVLNPNDPWLPYQSNINDFEEMHDGSWFQNGCSQSSDDPNLFNLGIILYTDKTGKGQVNPHGMEPVVFTLSLFREAVCQKPECWRPLGFVPEFRKSSSALERVQKQSKITSGRLVRNYHRVLDTILSGLIDCQKSPPIVRIRLGNEWKFVRVNIILEAILGDALSNDVICGRVQNRSATSMRLCRACHVPQKESDDSRHCCKFLVQSHMERITLAALGPEMDSSNPEYYNSWHGFVNEMVSSHEDVSDSYKKTLRNKYDVALNRRKDICTEILRVVLGSHVVDNAFFRVNMGDNPRGVFGVAPTDPMHAVEEGIIPDFLDVVITPLPDSAKKKWILWLSPFLQKVLTGRLKGQNIHVFLSVGGTHL